MTKPSSARPTKVTHSLTDYRPFITTEHQHTRPMHWLIDSGATRTICFTDQRTPPGNDFTYTGTANYRINGAFSTKSKKLQTFNLETLNTPPVSGVALSRSDIKKPHKTDGIIGMDLLTRHRATLHIKERKLSWHNGKLSGSTGTPVQLTRHPGTGHIILKTTHGNTKLNFIIDTGAKESLLSYRSATKAKLRLSSTNKSLSGLHSGSRGVFLTPKIPLQVSTSTSITINQFYVTDLGNVTSKFPATGALPVDGLLGYDFLKNNGIAIDFSSATLYLKSSKTGQH